MDPMQLFRSKCLGYLMPTTLALTVTSETFYIVRHYRKQRRRLAVCKRRLDLSIQNDLYALTPYGRSLVQLS